MRKISDVQNASDVLPGPSVRVVLQRGDPPHVYPFGTPSPAGVRPFRGQRPFVTRSCTLPLAVVHRSQTTMPVRLSSSCREAHTVNFGPVERDRLHRYRPPGRPDPHLPGARQEPAGCGPRVGALENSGGKGRGAGGPGPAALAVRPVRLPSEMVGAQRGPDRLRGRMVRGWFHELDARRAGSQLHRAGVRAHRSGRGYAVLLPGTRVERSGVRPLVRGSKRLDKARASTESAGDGGELVAD